MKYKMYLSAFTKNKNIFVNKMHKYQSKLCLGFG